MEKRTITTEQIVSFGQFLREDERSTATVEKYLREVRLFAAFLNGTEVTKSSVAAWKAHLLEENYNPTTVNGKLSAIDRFSPSRAGRTAGSSIFVSSGVCSGNPIGNSQKRSMSV